MSQRPRVHIAHGTYYAVQVGGAGHDLFASPDDYARFEQLLATALLRTGTRALAYCWLPGTVHLALQLSQVPLGRFIQGFTSRYARDVQADRGVSGHLFARRYRAILLDAKQWLLPLVRYLHYLPILHGHTTVLPGWRHTSHRAYLGDHRIDWLHTQPALRLLPKESDARGSYLRLMQYPPSGQEIRCIEQGDDGEPQILGGEVFRQTLPRAVRTIRSKLTLDQLIDRVCQTLDAERAHVFSRSRSRPLTLARAVIAWHATERGIATLTQVAARMRRHPSTLSTAIRDYRIRRPELFTLNALHHLEPLA